MLPLVKTNIQKLEKYQSIISDELLEEIKELAEKLGEAAKETVREKFLMPRLLRDYLKLFEELI